MSEGVFPRRVWGIPWLLRWGRPSRGAWVEFFGVITINVSWEFSDGNPAFVEVDLGRMPVGWVTFKVEVTPGD